MEKLKGFAKINLSLRILEQRSDNFHNIDSIAMPIDLADTVDFELNSGREIECYMDGKLCGEGNTAVKVCKELQKYQNFGAKIHIKKNIPFCSGLGGSSADAAAILKYCSQKFGFDEQTVRKIAESIGSDVYFLAKGKAARLRGKGEILEELPSFEPLNILLLKDRKGVSSKEAYHIFAKKNDYSDKSQKIASNNELQITLQKNDLSQFSKFIYNDFLTVSSFLCKDIDKNINLLKGEGALAAGLSGSGSAVFGIFESENDCQKAKQRFFCKAKFVFCAKSR